MDIDIDQIAAILSPIIGSISKNAAALDEFLRTHITFVPPMVIYFGALMLGVVLIVYATKVAVKLAIFVVLPTIGSALLVTRFFPELQATTVLPATVAVFAGLFILKK